MAVSILRRHQKKARIEVIPLIDVVFFLLATFVLFTLSLTRLNGMKVQLPAASTGELSNPAGAITITVTEGGELAWDSEPVTLDRFLDQLQALRAVAPETQILINGDERADFARAVYVFDEVRKAGIERVEIVTRIAERAP